MSGCAFVGGYERLWMVVSGYEWLCTVVGDCGWLWLATVDMLQLTLSCSSNEVCYCCFSYQTHRLYHGPWYTMM